MNKQLIALETAKLILKNADESRTEELETIVCSLSSNQRVELARYIKANKLSAPLFCVFDYSRQKWTITD